MFAFLFFLYQFAWGGELQVDFDYDTTRRSKPEDSRVVVDLIVSLFTQNNNKKNSNKDVRIVLNFPERWLQSPIKSDISVFKDNAFQQSTYFNNSFDDIKASSTNNIVLQLSSIFRAKEIDENFVAGEIPPLEHWEVLYLKSLEEEYIDTFSASLSLCSTPRPRS